MNRSKPTASRRSRSIPPPRHPARTVKVIQHRSQPILILSNILVNTKSCCSEIAVSVRRHPAVEISVDRCVFVGKTCLLVRFHDGIFLNGTCIATIGIDYRRKLVSIGDKQVDLQIFDTVNSLVGVIPHARWTFGFKLSEREREEKSHVIMDSPF